MSGSGAEAGGVTLSLTVTKKTPRGQLDPLLNGRHILRLFISLLGQPWWSMQEDSERAYPR